MAGVLTASAMLGTQAWRVQKLLKEWRPQAAASNSTR